MTKAEKIEIQRREITKVIGTAAIIGTAAAVAGHAVYSAVKLSGKDEHKENENEYRNDL